jgi:hypothetical protein
MKADPVLIRITTALSSMPAWFEERIPAECAIFAADARLLEAAARGEWFMSSRHHRLRTNPMTTPILKASPHDATRPESAS